MPIMTYFVWLMREWHYFTRQGSDFELESFDEFIDWLADAGAWTE